MASAPPPANIDVGNVISRGFAAMRGNFLTFFAFSLLLSGLPTFFWQYWTMAVTATVDPETAPGDYIAYATSIMMGGLLLSFVAGSLLQGVLIRSTVLYLSGRPADIGQSAVTALRLILPIIGLSIVVGVLTMIGFILLIVPGIMVYCAFIVAIPALIEERRGVFGSMQRSRDLTRGSRMMVFLLLVVIWVFSIVVTGVINVAVGVPMSDPFALNPVAPLILGIAAGLGTAITTLIFAVLTGALYVELRTVKEGASTDDLASIFE